MGVLSLCNVWKRSPSNIMDISDPYTAYCFDEACAYIMKMIESGEEPQFRSKYSSFKDLYSKYE